MSATTSIPPPGNGFSVQGYVTDPKLVGYQILTNYESTYWRSLVGNDAWSLYEVLRSFCHDGNKTCYPSIKLLTSILGFKDKRALIGRVKRVNGKEYEYPGLIEILQNNHLIVAEFIGKEPQVKYVFHVNLTPGVLTSEQLDSLPKILQRKHAQVLERCQKAQEDLESKKRPARFPKDGSLTEGTKGVGNSHPPVGNSHTPGGKFPPEQHPINNTHRIQASMYEDLNNNSSGNHDSKQDVVVVLTDQGISEKVAQRLAQRYNRARVNEKIEFLAFLQEEHPEMVQNPHGWLRRAIEEDYDSPDGFLSQEERERQHAEEEREAKEEEEKIQVAAQRTRELQEQIQSEKDAYIRQLREQYDTTDEDRSFWEEAQQEIQYSTNPDIFAQIADTHILKRTQDTVLIGVENELEWRHLQHPGTQKAINRVLARMTNQPVELEVVKWDRGEQDLH